MLNWKATAAAVVLSCSLFAPLAHADAARAKDYQVTGVVLDISEHMVVIQKGDEKWEIDIDSFADKDKLKKGDKVTLHYKMLAKSIDETPAKK